MKGFSLLETSFLILLLGLIWSFHSLSLGSFNQKNTAIKQAVILLHQEIIATSWDQSTRIIRDFAQFKILNLEIKSKDQNISIYPNHSCSPALVTNLKNLDCAFTLSLRCNIRLLC